MIAEAATRAPLAGQARRRVDQRDGMRMGPDQPPMKSTGVDVVRSLGGLWIIAEGEGEMPGGGTAKTIMTLGYDPRLGATWGRSSPR